MTSFYQIIAEIERRPSMYLGKPSISNLRSFLSGYILARRELNQPQTFEEKEFSEFKDWLKAKYRISSDQSWDKIILFFCEDKSRALLEFFKLFSEFSYPESQTIQPNLIEVKMNLSESAIDTLT